MLARLAGFLIVLSPCAALGQTSAPEAGPPGNNPARATAAPGNPQPGKVDERIEELISQLGDDRFEVREAATRSLAAMGNRARLALQRASKSEDLETAFRARRIIEALPKLTHTVVDALGLPIPDATVILTISKQPGKNEVPVGREAPQVTTALTEEDGGIAIPEVPDSSFRVSATLQSPEYGRGQCDVDAPGANKVIRFPLVRRTTEAYARAIKGRLVTPQGKPVAGAVISCSEVRTPGQGLINGLHPYGEALSDEEGEFTYYLPNENRNRERGDLIPAGSRYHLSIKAPGDDTMFPVAGMYANVEPVRIEMPQATRFHRFRFEAADGGWIEDLQQLEQMRVQLESFQGGERFLVNLDPQSVISGRKLVPGKYRAESFINGKRVAYLPVVVSAGSPDELEFLLPHPLTYRGRVVHGVTGKPVADAFLMGFWSTSHNNLALLNEDDWKLLRDTPSNPPDDHPAIKRLNTLYGVRGLVRTDSEGKFELTHEPDQEIYGLIAFDADSIPFNVRLGSLKPDQDYRVDAGEFPLFPAARILVRPVFAGDRLSVLPRWRPAETGQPEWFARFQAAGKSSDREFEYSHWLTINEQQPVYVPAGVRLRVRFESPYDDKWAPAVVETLQLEPGETKEIGDLQFAASLPAVVRVVDRDGKPVEGVPVRRKYQTENSWCVAHNTDGDGLAHFHLHPSAAGQFWVSDLPGAQEVRMAANLLTGFKIEDQPPKEQYTITVTDEQIKLLLSAKPPLPPSP